MEQERTSSGLTIHGVKVKPGQLWNDAVAAHEGADRRLENSVIVQRVVYGTVYTTPQNKPFAATSMWNCGDFADKFRPAPADTGLVERLPDAEPERWTDAEWAAEQVALARRQAEVARAEARELRAERDRACTDLRSIAQVVIEEIGAVGPEDAVDAVARLLEKHREALAALEAARAELRAVERISLRPIGADGPWVSPRVVAEGRDPATRTRALPVVPATCGECRYVERRDASREGRGIIGLCRHPDEPLGVHVEPTLAPPTGCPISAELAKAGGA